MHRRFVRPVIVLLLSAAGWSQSSALQTYSTGKSADYIYPTKAQAVQLAAASESIPTSLDYGEPVTYRGFWSNATYNLTEYRGKYVSLLLPAAWTTGLTQNERRTLLDRSDLLYSHYRDLIGQEPAGTGPLRIAIITETCGWGCGWIGYKGVEIMDAGWALDDMKHALALGDVPLVIGHEMCHNFDVFSAYLSYVPDAAHAWTVFLDAYMQVYTQQGYLNTNPGQTLMERLLSTWMPYLDSPAVTWQSSIRNGDPSSNLAPLTWGGLHWRFAQLHGPAAVRRAIRFWQNYAVTHAPPSTPEEKEDLDIEGLAAGAALNLSCYVDAWRWYASPGARARMLTTYGSANPNCQNGEVVGDHAWFGGQPVREPGDFPGSPAFYRVPYPAHITGTITPGDVDSFQFALPASGLVGLYIHSGAGFTGSLCPDGMGCIGVAENNFISLSQQYAAGNWGFVVASAMTSTGSAPYSVDVYPLDPWPPPPWGRVLPMQKTSAGYRLSVAATALPPKLPQQPTHVRFWVSGFGVVATLPYQPNASFDWTPGICMDGTYSYRAQLFAGDLPVVLDTDSEYFSISTHACGVPIYGDVYTYTTSGFRFNNATRLFQQTLSITMFSDYPPNSGPYGIVLKLAEGIKLHNPSGTYTCGSDAGNPYVRLDTGSGNGWPVGKTATVLLEFENPTFQPIRYSWILTQQVQYQ